MTALFLVRVFLSSRALFLLSEVNSHIAQLIVNKMHIV